MVSKLIASRLGDLKNDPLLQALIANAVDGIVVMDVSGHIQSYNTACQKLFGYESKEIIGQSVTILIARDDIERDGPLGNHRETLEKRIVSVNQDVTGQRKDGTTFPMYLSIGEGKLGGENIFVAIIHDLTDRRKAEEEIREREAGLRSILDTIPDAVVVIDENGIIESFSAAASRLFGYSAEAAIGQHAKMLLPSSYREQHDGYLTKYLSGGEQGVAGMGRVIVGQSQDGHTFPMELSLGEICKNNKRRFTCFFRDMTERQGTEQRLHDLQAELIHVSRVSVMGHMCSALAHELNQPLTAIVNYVKAAQRFLDSSGDIDRAREVMDKAAKQTLRASAIIKNLRSFIEKRDRDKLPESLIKVIEEAIALALVGSTEFNIKVKLNLDPAIPAVMIDKIQIQQVLINLIRNGVEAMMLGGSRQLTITTRIAERGFAEVTVSDTGPGLPKTVLAQLFQPFVTTKANGMGIGLTICQSIIEAHGGRIWANPNPLVGASLSFTLPFALPAAIAA